MKQTLLEMTQDILAAMDSDEVNSINDTAEALQVATLIRGVYYEIINSVHPHEIYGLFELEATGSSTPTVMTLPSNVIFLDWVKYNQETTDNPEKQFRDVKFMELSEFLERMYALNEDNDEIETCELTDAGSSIDLLYYNDRFPTYYTTYNDSTLIFDAYNLEEESNLVANKSLAYGRVLPTFTLDDDFTPDLDAPQFVLLVNEAKALAFQELKQIEHRKAEGNARRHRIRAQKSRRAVSTTNEFDRLPNYARRVRG